MLRTQCWLLCSGADFRARSTRGRAVVEARRKAGTCVTGPWHAWRRTGALLQDWVMPVSVVRAGGTPVRGCSERIHSSTGTELARDQRVELSPLEHAWGITAARSTSRDILQASLSGPETALTRLRTSSQ